MLFLINLVNKTQGCSLNAEKMTSFVSDETSVMTGRFDGVLQNSVKRLNKTLSSFHCICHRVVLACADASDDVSFIKDVEATLKHLWHFFENSSKKLQLTLKHKKT